MDLKHYIFFTVDIHPIGGTSSLAAGRARYLERNGWKVTIFFTGSPHGESDIPSLTKYVSGCGFAEMWEYRPYRMSKQYRDEILDKMVKILQIDSTIPNEILIESHDDFVAYWAELLAEKVHGRHFYLTCNEAFRTPWSAFDENLDFFLFKYQRHEIFGSIGALQKLFGGYRGMENFERFVPEGVSVAKEEDAIQDVENQDVELKTRGGGADFSIAYAGRTEKQYVPAIFRGIADFSKSHPDKKIRFIIVGKLWNQDQLSMFNGISNIEIIPLGNLIPIPRFLFDRLDVVCAGSQTAIFCSYENVPVIIANAHGDTTPGCLYFDTNETVHNEHLPQISYSEALEKVLIKREYQNRKPNLPERHPADWHHEKTLEVMRSNQSPTEYFTEKFKTDLRRNWIAQFPFHKIQPGARIVIYGYGDVGKDYQQQIENGNFCKLVAIVADDHENYDRTILPPEKLSELEYDGIVIAEFPNQQRIDAITSKIFRITGKRNFVYDWKILRIR